MIVGNPSPKDPIRAAYLRGLHDPELFPQLESWVRSMERRGHPAPDTRRRYEQQVRAFVTPGMRRSGFTRPAIRAWLEELPIGQPNRYRAALSAFATFLVLEEVLDFNPVTAIPAAKESRPRDRHLSVAEAEALVAAIPSPLYRAIHAFALATAADVRSVLEYRASDLDLGEGSVWVRGTKTETRARRCYVTPAWRPLWEREVLPALADRQTLAQGTYYGARAALMMACRALGIADYTTKDHRHTWAVQAFKDGLPLHAIAQQLGHASPALALRVYGRHRADARAFNPA